MVNRVRGGTLLVLVASVALGACGRSGYDPVFRVDQKDAAGNSGGVDAAGNSGGVDAAGNSARLVVYISAEATTGDLGGYLGADQLCQAQKPDGIQLSEIRAFLCAVDLDLTNLPERAGYPRNVPIAWYRPPVGADVSGELTTFASNWDDLLDGEIAISATTATGVNGEIWTGCSTLGVGSSTDSACSYRPAQCSCGSSTDESSKWSEGGSGFYATQGSLDAVDAYWIHNPCPAFSDCSCQTLARIMCIGEVAP